VRKLLPLTGMLALVCALGASALSADSVIGFAPAVDFAAGDGPVSIAVGDLNGDARPDLATADMYANSVSVLLGEGDGRFGPQRAYQAGGDPRAIAIGDLNRDGRPDLVTVSADADKVSVRLNGGDGTFAEARSYSDPGGPVAVAIGDLNGDGGPDVVTANRTSHVSVLLSRGNGTLQSVRQSRSGLEPVSVAVGDLNADGRPDLVTANLEANSVSLLLNLGGGRFGPRPRINLPVGRSPTDVAIGDLNGDGRPDIVTSNLDANTVSVLLNGGDGNFRARNDYSAGGDPRSLAIADLDGDGRPDIVTVNAQASTASVLRNDGNGVPQPARDYAVGSRPVSVATSDLNGDGRPDVAAAGLDADAVSVLLGSTAVWCIAPEVAGRTLAAAAHTIEAASCRVGTISHAYSNSIEKDTVSGERPRTGTTLPVGSAIDLVVSDGPDPNRPRGLLLWNGLGSTQEVTHSVYGPNLTLFDCRDRVLTIPIFLGHCSTDVQGKLRFVRGVHDRALTVGPGRYSSEARVHTAILRESILSPERGAVEAWFRQRKNPVAFEHDVYRIFGGPYSLTGVDEVMLFSGFWGRPRLQFELFFGQEPPPFVPAHLVAVRSLVDGRTGFPIRRFNGRWIHVAGVWDRHGIAGTRDTVRLYVNGKVVAASRATSWGTTTCARRISARPAGACFPDIAGCNDRCAGAFAVDDVKLWNYAKTDYPRGRMHR
jgi:FG-GAP-like repeat/Concanavalin A-like lectin/glucanases superfamily/PASTA domain